MASGEKLRHWPGAKAAVFRHIVNLMPPHELYLEPFLGDGAVMRAKRPARLNIGLDLDPDAPGLAWLARLAEKADDSACSIVRSRDAGSGVARRRSSSALASAAAIGGSGGGGLPGTVSSGPARGDRVDRLSPEPARSAELARNGDPGSHGGNGDADRHGGNGAAADLAEELKRHYRFGCLDGIEFLRVYPFTGRELVYCDPPYVMSTRSGKRLYKHEMSDVDHRRFLRVVMELPCMVMVSGYWSQLYADAFTSWNSIHFKVMTRGGRPATEWLWFNFPAPTVLHDDRFLGEGFRARANLTKMKQRWVERLKAMSQTQRQALLSAIASIDYSGE